MSKFWKQGRDYKHLLGRCENIMVLAIEDPHTPVIVAHKTKDASSTFDAAHGEGELIGRREDYILSEDENAFLDKMYDEAEEWFDEQRPEGWEG
jgi:hypothetical protein